MIDKLKSQLRSAVLRYRDATEHLDCGANMAAVISADVSKAAREANEIARKLKAIDPSFPASWVPYPEGT